MIFLTTKLQRNFFWHEHRLCYNGTPDRIPVVHGDSGLDTLRGTVNQTAKMVAWEDLPSNLQYFSITRRDAIKSNQVARAGVTNLQEQLAEDGLFDKALNALYNDHVFQKALQGSTRADDFSRTKLFFDTKGGKKLTQMPAASKTADGDYGHGTSLAVAYAQYVNNITVDGAFGRETEKIFGVAEQVDAAKVAAEVAAEVAATLEALKAWLGYNEEPDDEGAAVVAETSGIRGYRNGAAVNALVEVQLAESGLLQPMIDAGIETDYYSRLRQLYDDWWVVETFANRSGGDHAPLSFMKPDGDDATIAAYQKSMSQYPAFFGIPAVSVNGHFDDPTRAAHEHIGRMRETVSINGMKVVIANAGGRKFLVSYGPEDQPEIVHSSLPEREEGQDGSDALPNKGNDQAHQVDSQANTIPLGEPLTKEQIPLLFAQKGIDIKHYQLTNELFRLWVSVEMAAKFRLGGDYSKLDTVEVNNIFRDNAGVERVKILKKYQEFIRENADFFGIPSVSVDDKWGDEDQKAHDFISNMLERVSVNGVYDTVVANVAGGRTLLASSALMKSVDTNLHKFVARNPLLNSPRPQARPANVPQQPTAVNTSNGSAPKDNFVARNPLLNSPRPQARPANVSQQPTAVNTPNGSAPEDKFVARNPLLNSPRPQARPANVSQQPTAVNTSNGSAAPEDNDSGIDVTKIKPKVTSTAGEYKIVWAGLPDGARIRYSSNGNSWTSKETAYFTTVNANGSRDFPSIFLAGVIDNQTGQIGTIELIYDGEIIDLTGELSPQERTIHPDMLQAYRDLKERGIKLSKEYRALLTELKDMIQDDFGGRWDQFPKFRALKDWKMDMELHVSTIRVLLPERIDMLKAAIQNLEQAKLKAITFARSTDTSLKLGTIDDPLTPGDTMELILSNVPEGAKISVGGSKYMFDYRVEGNKNHHQVSR